MKKTLHCQFSKPIFFKETLVVVKVFNVPTVKIELDGESSVDINVPFISKEMDADGSPLIIGEIVRVAKFSPLIKSFELIFVDKIRLSFI